MTPKLNYDDRGYNIVFYKNKAYWLDTDKIHTYFKDYKNPTEEEMMIFRLSEDAEKCNLRITKYL